MMWTDACSWTRDRLPLLAGGELVGDERRRAERHALTCPSCRNLLDSHRGVVDLLHLAAEVAPASPEAPSLWSALDRQIREERRPAPARDLSGLWRWSWSWPTVGVAMAASLLVSVGLTGLAYHGAPLLQGGADLVNRPAPKPAAVPVPEPLKVAITDPADAEIVVADADRTDPVQANAAGTR